MFESKWLQFGMLLVILAIPYGVWAQMIPEDPNHRRDLVDVSMEVDVTFDESSAEYTYVYQVLIVRIARKESPLLRSNCLGAIVIPKRPKGGQFPSAIIIRNWFG